MRWLEIIYETDRPSQTLQVLVVWRSLAIPDNSWDQIVPDLMEKYGQWNTRVSQPSIRFVWMKNPPSAQCSIVDRQWKPWADSTDFPGRKKEQVFDLAMPLPTSAYANCGPIVEAQHGNGGNIIGNGSFYVFQTKMYDLGMLGTVIAQQPRQPGTKVPL